MHESNITVLDQFHLPLTLSASVEWPDVDWVHWHFYNYEDSVKYASKDPQRLTPACKLLLGQLAGLSLAPLDSFPDLSLYGAGMHMIRKGGYLKRHQDGDRHPITGWYRKFNAILFLSDCVGGQLLVEGHDPITPRVGKLVGFDSSIPHEVTEVTSGVRKTLSLFWWGLKGTGDSTSAQFE